MNKVNKIKAAIKILESSQEPAANEIALDILRGHKDVNTWEKIFGEGERPPGGGVE